MNGEKYTKINDRWMYIVVYPIMAFLAVHIGNDNTFRQLVRIPSYYTDLLLAFGCTFGIGFYFRRLFRTIDQKFDWTHSLRQRIRRHLILGILLPAAVIIGIEAVYLLLINIDLKNSSVFYLELPVVILFCLLINLIYIFLYHRAYTESFVALAETRNNLTKPAGKENFVVHSGTTKLNVPIDDIAYFAVLEKHTFLITRGGKQYLYDTTIDELNKQVAQPEFFRLNRQFIARRNSISLYRQTDTRRLIVDLIPPPEKPVYVSKTKALKFYNWLNNAN
jgi:hypothetical protein